MKLLVLDLETSDLKPEVGDILEIGAAVYDTSADDVLWAYGTLLYSEKPNTGEFVNKISQRALGESKVLMGENDPMGPIKTILSSGEIIAIVAHNGETFDRPWLEKKFGVIINPKTKERVPWIDSCGDIEYPNTNGSMKLLHLAVDHGIPVGIMHRALSDVLLTIELLRKVSDLDSQLQIALSPRALFEALVSFERKDVAKNLGWRWAPKERRWIKKLPLDTPLEPTSERPFRIRRI
jgi:DNA polymerase III epsilon subunit-like protein